MRAKNMVITDTYTLQVGLLNIRRDLCFRGELLKVADEDYVVVIVGPSPLRPGSPRVAVFSLDFQTVDGFSFQIEKGWPISVLPDNSEIALDAKAAYRKLEAQLRCKPGAAPKGE